MDTGNFWPLFVLSSLGSLSLILKVEGTTDHSHYNISFFVYAFTYILLGTPAAILVILVSHLIEWVWHKYRWYIQIFNLTSYVLVTQAVGSTFDWLNPGRSIASWEGVLAVLAGMALFTFLNHLMIGLVVWLARGESFLQSGIFDFFPLTLDFILLSMGASAALVWEFNPFGIILVLLPIYLIYSTLKVPALERRTETDAKTGLFNAKYFSQVLESELTRANRFDRPMTVIMADLDLLRNINNTYGHLAGDEVLIGVAKILRESVRDYDIVARFGGEEFALLIPESSPKDTFARAEAIRQTIENAEFTVPTSLTPIRITMSFGVAGREGFNQAPRDIIHNADIALYHAKLTGRNRTSLYNGPAYQERPDDQNSSEGASPALSFEERIRLCEFPYQPNPLREDPSSATNSAEEVDFPTALSQIQPGGTPAASDPNLPADGQAGKAETGEAQESPGSKVLLSIYIGGLLVSALGLFVANLQPPMLVDWVGLAVFTGIVILAEWLSIDIYVRDTSISTSAAPILAGALLFGPLGAVALSAAFAAVALLKHGSSPSRFIFNFSNQMIASMLYLGIILFSGVPYGSWPIPLQIILCLFAAGITYLSTTFLVAIAINLDMGAPISQVWNEKFSWLAPYYVSMGLIAFALIFSYRLEGVLGTTVILIPLLLLRFSQVQYIERTRAIVKELREKNLTLENNAREITGLNDGLFAMLAEAIDLRDPSVKKHSDQVSRYAVMIARRLGLPARQVEMIRKAGLLHDIGKLGIPDSILNKRSALNQAEFATIETHPRRGAELLQSFRALHGLIPVVRHHHERFDGGGYPDGLKGSQIPLEARIVGVADAVEAMASDRPYRRAHTLQEIEAELVANSGTQFDPQIVQAFLQIIRSGQGSLIVNSGQSAISGPPGENGSRSPVSLGAYHLRENES